MTARENGTGAAERAATAHTYGTGVRAGAAAALLLGAVAVTASWLAPAPAAARSALLGSGLVVLSAAATALVSAQLFRSAPAATAPALAALYLLKVLALGWLLLGPGPPGWLAPGVFVLAAVAAVLGTTAGTALLARRVTDREARVLVARARTSTAQKEPM